MQKILAMAWLTWKAAIRFRLFTVIAVLLVLAVVGLPLAIKDDGTAAGFTQIILTYTLSAVTLLLGISTLWLSCGTLARDIEDCQIQVIATKPIARWQIWLGKWLGIASLNAVLLLLAGTCIYGLLQWRASKLPAREQADLRQQVLVARGSAVEKNYDAEIETEAEQALQQRLKDNPVTTADLAEVRDEIRKEVKSEYELVQPGYTRIWRINLGLAKNYLQNKPLQLRIKFNAANHNPSGTFIGAWQIGDPNSTNVVQLPPMSLAPDTFHEFSIPPNLYDHNGDLTIIFLNVNDTALIFPLEDGMQVLYPESSFTVNFIRALGVIFCWLVLLSAIGLMAASFLSFPVAAFFSLAMLIVAFSSSTLSENVDLSSTPGAQLTLSDKITMPIYKALLDVLNLAENFSPIDNLSTGHSVPWSELATAFVQIVLFLGGIFALVGIVLFNRRELAAAQTQ
jgi:ABC-type transport system involved in multi-copper enzyme maturation permease subunit